MSSRPSHITVSLSLFLLFSIIRFRWMSILTESFLYHRQFLPIFECKRFDLIRFALNYKVFPCTMIRIHHLHLHQFVVCLFLPFNDDRTQLNIQWMCVQQPSNANKCSKKQNKKKKKNSSIVVARAHSLLANSKRKLNTTWMACLFVSFEIVTNDLLRSDNYTSSSSFLFFLFFTQKSYFTSATITVKPKIHANNWNWISVCLIISADDKMEMETFYLYKVGHVRSIDWKHYLTGCFILFWNIRRHLMWRGPTITTTLTFGFDFGF